MSLYPVINIVINEHEDPICNFDSNDINTDDVVIFLSFALMMIYALLSRDCEVVDQIQDKTDNVDVVIDDHGEPIDDFRDVGNR